MAETNNPIYVRPTVGNPCPYCGKTLIECGTCDGGTVEWYEGNCDDCQGGYGVSCSEPPQDDYELWGDQYCRRHGCELWREAY